MSYERLAAQLLDVQANMLQIPAAQQMAKLLKGEYFVLNYLSTHEKIIHPKELSKKMSVSTARIASLLNHMEEKKLIRRIDDPEDSRQIIVELTPEGRAMIEKTREEVIQLVASMLERMGSEDAEAYVRSQEKLWMSVQS